MKIFPGDAFIQFTNFYSFLNISKALRQIISTLLSWSPELSCKKSSSLAGKTFLRDLRSMWSTRGLSWAKPSIHCLQGTGHVSDHLVSSRLAVMAVECHWSDPSLWHVEKSTTLQALSEFLTHKIIKYNNIFGFFLTVNFFNILLGNNR